MQQLRPHLAAAGDFVREAAPAGVSSMAMTTLRPFVAFFLLTGMAAAGARGADMAPRQILADYETVRAALAADDLTAATAAAQKLATAEIRLHHAALADSAQGIAAAGDLTAARAAFKTLSNEAVALARQQKGYFIMTCPMAQADWVQSTREVSNPYLGKDMPTCGSVKEETKG